MPDINLLLQSLARTDSDIRELREDISKLRDEIKDLQFFKWKVYGMTAAISSLLGFVTHFFGGK